MKPSETHCQNTPPSTVFQMPPAQPPRDGPIQRHFSASKPDEAGKPVLAGMGVKRPIFSTDIGTDRKSGMKGEAIDFESSTSDRTLIDRAVMLVFATVRCLRRVEEKNE